MTKHRIFARSWYSTLSPHYPPPLPFHLPGPHNGKTEDPDAGLRPGRLCSTLQIHLALQLPLGTSALTSAEPSNFELFLRLSQFLISFPPGQPTG